MFPPKNMINILNFRLIKNMLTRVGFRIFTYLVLSDCSIGCLVIQDLNN